MIPLFLIALGVKDPKQPNKFTFEPGSTQTDHNYNVDGMTYGTDITFWHIISGYDTPYHHPEGGALEMHNCENLTIEKSKFVACWSTTGKRGGAAFLETTVLCIISECTIQDCYSDQGGGALYFGDTIGNVFVVGCDIVNCNGWNGTESVGGAIAMTSDFDLLIVNKTKVRNCQCARTGGAISVSDSTVGKRVIVSDGSVFTGNIAENGGGFYIGFVKRLEARNANFTLNTVRSNGTSVTLLGYDHVTFTDCLFYVQRDSGFVSMILGCDNAKGVLDFIGCCFNSTTGPSNVNHRRSNGIVQHVYSRAKGEVTFDNMCFDMDHDSSLLFDGVPDPSSVSSCYFNCIDCRPGGETPTPKPTRTPIVTSSEPTTFYSPTTRPPFTSQSGTTTTPTSQPHTTITTTSTSTSTTPTTVTPTASKSRTPTRSHTPPTASSEHKGLSSGAIAGISVGCVGFIAIVLVAVICFIRKSRNEEAGLDTNALLVSDAPFHTNFSTVTEALIEPDQPQGPQNE